MIVRSRGSAVALGAWLSMMLLLGSAVAEADWQLPVIVENAAGEQRTVVLGVATGATDGIDVALGESELPPLPPTTVLDVRLQVPGTLGTALDLRDDSLALRVHKIEWQAGAAGYPITLRWDRSALPSAALVVSDDFGGFFVGPTSMFDVDSITIGPEQSFVRRLRIDVDPTGRGPQPPIISGIPEQRTVFAGQRFPEIDLDAAVDDFDTPDGDIVWIPVVESPVLASVRSIGGSRVLELRAPADWVGESTLRLLARDPDGLEDEITLRLRAQQGGIIQFEVPLAALAADGRRSDVVIGLLPDATAGVDPDLGEVELPPPAPAGVFDTRLEAPGLFDLHRDYRPSTVDETEFVWRVPTDSVSIPFPLILSWPVDLPEGSFAITDPANVFAEIDMTTQTMVVVPPTYVGPALRIRVNAAGDSIPPTAPAPLQLTDLGTSTASLSWTASFDENFAYYEVLFDEQMVDGEARYVWDLDQDPALGDPSTTSTVVQLPPGLADLHFAVRAWDTFGNASALIRVGATPVSSPSRFSLRLASIVPNPFGQSTTIGLRVPRMQSGALEIFDVAGRRVRSLFLPSSEGVDRQLVWDGRDNLGSDVASGIYLLRARVGRETAMGRVVVLR